MKDNNTKALAKMSMLTALAIILSYVEAFIPFPVPIPGIKLGLSNIVIVYAVFMLKSKQAFIILIAKIVLSSLIFTSLNAAVYALSGGVLSLISMLLMKKLGLPIVLSSIVGAVFHNCGQLLIACLMLGIAVNSFTFLSLATSLFISGILTGLAIGIVSSITISILQKQGIG